MQFYFAFLHKKCVSETWIHFIHDKEKAMDTCLVTWTCPFVNWVANKMANFGTEICEKMPKFSVWIQTPWIEEFSIIQDDKECLALNHRSNPLDSWQQSYDALFHMEHYGTGTTSTGISLFHPFILLSALYSFEDFE